MEEREIISALASREDSVRRAGHGELFLRFRGWVYGTALRISGNRVLAEEICQDTFVQVLKHVDTFRGECSLKHWLLTIAVNLSRRVLVREAARARVEKSAAEQRSHSCPNPGKSDDMERFVQEALAELPPSQRIVLTLSYLEGLSAKEIGEIVGCGEGTVWSRLYYAKKALAQKWRERS